MQAWSLLSPLSRRSIFTWSHSAATSASRRLTSLYAGEASNIESIAALAWQVHTVFCFADPLFAVAHTLGQLHRLTTACGTPEQHARSGESDRLLTITAILATTAARKNGSSDDAYDIVACINAARLVPGDVESRERTKYIDAAAAKLASILDCHDSLVLRKGVKRPNHPEEGPPSNGFTPN